MSDKTDKAKGIIEKILLTGIGAMALTAEKTKELVNELIAKGAITVEQGKAINEELKRAMKARREANKAQEAPTASLNFDTLDALDADQLAALKIKIFDIESQRASASNPMSGLGQDNTKPEDTP
jgi:polyhydroxyalkanoate synthesis regulator phasin